MGPLIILNVLAWGYIIYTSKPQKKVFPFSSQDLHWVKEPYCEEYILSRIKFDEEEKLEEKELKLMFSNLLEKSSYERSLRDHLEDNNVYYSHEGMTLWVDGIVLEVGNPEDLDFFLTVIRPKAISEREFNSKLLEDGGWKDLDIAHLRLLGYSVSGANAYLELGANPNDAKPLV